MKPTRIMIQAGINYLADQCKSDAANLFNTKDLFNQMLISDVVAGSILCKIDDLIENLNEIKSYFNEYKKQYLKKDQQESKEQYEKERKEMLNYDPSNPNEPLPF